MAVKASQRTVEESMDSTVTPTPPKFPQDFTVADGPIAPTDEPRVSLAWRFLIIFSIGIGATLAWQSYGDAARAMLANSSPQLGWLAPQTAPLAQTTPSMVTPAADTASSDLQQLTAAVASVRQSVDQLAAQLAAGQQQVADNIAKLHADEQKILQKLTATPQKLSATPRKPPATPQKLSGTPPGAPAAPARKPTPVTAPPSPSESPSLSAEAR
jgi:hypothetical protein